MKRSGLWSDVTRICARCGWSQLVRNGKKTWICYRCRKLNSAEDSCVARAKKAR